MNKQSYVVETLNLEVTEAVNNKLVKAEAKLAELVLSNGKVKTGVITKILKDNKVEFDANELTVCINEYKKLVKETGGEFVTSKKKVVPLSIDTDAFKECGLIVDIDEDDKEEEEVVAEETTVVEDETSIDVHEFVLSIIDDEFKTMVKDGFGSLEYENVDEFKNFIYWALRGRIALCDLSQFVFSMLEEANINELNKFKRPIESIVKILDEALVELSELSTSTDIKAVEKAYNNAIDRVMMPLCFVSPFIDFDIEACVKLVLACALDSFICADICGIEEVKDITEDDVNDFMLNLQKEINESNGKLENISIDSIFKETPTSNETVVNETIVKDTGETVIDEIINDFAPKSVIEQLTTKTPSPVTEETITDSPKHKIVPVVEEECDKVLTPSQLCKAQYKKFWSSI